MPVELELEEDVSEVWSIAELPVGESTGVMSRDDMLRSLDTLVLPRSTADNLLKRLVMGVTWPDCCFVKS